VKEFHERFGTEPAGVWSAPGRVNLIGEHTDYNDGFVLPFAIPMRTTVAARPADGPWWTVYSRETGETIVIAESDLEPGSVHGWAAYVAGIPWALRDAGHRAPFVDLAIASDVPLGAGLSSSAALTCAVLAALVDVGGLDLPRDEWPRTTTSARPPASWTSPRRRCAAPVTRCSSTAAAATASTCRSRCPSTPWRCW
jgi:galactokinase